MNKVAQIILIRLSLLRFRLREELEEIKKGHPDEPRDSKTNTSKFLALTLPPSHNAGKNGQV